MGTGGILNVQGLGKQGWDGRWLGLTVRSTKLNCTFPWASVFSSGQPLSGQFATQIPTVHLDLETFCILAVKNSKTETVHAQ